MERLARLWLAGWAASLFVAGLPASSSYQLNSYGFGNGGTAGSSSGAYRLNGLAGEVAGATAGPNYKIGAGENQVKEANVPTITLANTDNFYNKLLLTIGPQNNPSDAKYAVEISTDNFATTKYIESDLTIGTSFGISNFLTYATWGGSSGVFIRGLAPNTVYSVKAAAYRGAFTQSPWSPTASSATTSDPELSFDIDVSATDQSTSPPYNVAFGNLSVGTVTDAPALVWVSLATNAESGGGVYVSGQNAGLKSLSTGYIIPALTGDLGASAVGFGLQGASATQSSGGPLTLASPYNGAGNNVGIEDGNIRQIFTSSGPVVAGRGSINLVAKSQALTPSAADYAEVLTAIASASF